MLVAEGLTEAQIAERLWISPGTVPPQLQRRRTAEDGERRERHGCSDHGDRPAWALVSETGVLDQSGAKVAFGQAPRSRQSRQRPRFSAVASRGSCRLGSPVRARHAPSLPIDVSSGARVRVTRRAGRLTNTRRSGVQVERDRRLRSSAGRQVPVALRDTSCIRVPALLRDNHRLPSMTVVGQGTVRRMTQFPAPLLRTNVKPARSKRVRVPL